jgi:ribosomal protein L1
MPQPAHGTVNEPIRSVINASKIAVNEAQKEPAWANNVMKMHVGHIR